ncbi:MAG: PEP-CTERM sorting domain-containing protein [Acidobacteriota bacterium]
MQKLKIILCTTMLLFVSNSIPSFAVPVALPDPTQYAVRYDDFYSYSAKLLTAWGLPGFDGPVGVGGLDVVLGTGAGGIDNNPVGGGFQFPDPMSTPSGNGAGSDVFSGTWGLTGAFSPVTVDNLLAYLHTFGPDINIPVFNFDMSQSGGTFEERSLNVNGVVQLLDPSDNVVAYWAFDNITNHVFDSTSFVLSPATITANNPAPPFQPATVTNNTGSGKNDFIVYAPTMDLSLYTSANTGQTLRFAASFYMNGLNGSHEELFLTGSFAAPDIVATPEPGTMLLMGAGLLGATFLRRRMKKS